MAKIWKIDRVYESRRPIERANSKYHIITLKLGMAKITK